jgi:hypothetical protein
MRLGWGGNDVSGDHGRRASHSLTGEKGKKGEIQGLQSQGLEKAKRAEWGFCTLYPCIWPWVVSLSATTRADRHSARSPNHRTPDDLK